MSTTYYNRMTKIADQGSAYYRLHELLHDGDKIDFHIVKVASNGMSRQMRLSVDGFDFTRDAATWLGYRYNHKSRTMTVSGTGMDMRLHCALRLQCVLGLGLDNNRSAFVIA